MSGIIERMFDIDFGYLDADVDVHIRPWTHHAPSGAITLLLDEAETDAGAFDQLARIGTWEKVIAGAQARQCVEITGFVADAGLAPSHGMTADQGVESAQAEVGLMLNLSPGGTAWRVTDAQRLVEGFPAAFAVLQTGAITLTKARIIADGCADLSAEAAAAVEQRVLPRAPQQTNDQLRRAVARAVKREDAAAAERRRQRKRRERGVVLYPERDGMTTLSATLPAAEAVGMFAVLDQHARACGSADDRTMDARRVDALADLVLRETGFCSTGAGAATADRDDAVTALPVAPAPSRLPGIAPEGGTRTVANTVSIQIRVVVGLDTLQGNGDEPAELVGYGPITAAQARDIAADPTSTWRRLVTDPLSGAIVDYGTTRYRPPPDMVERVVSRHQYCQYPGCRTPAHRCDLDHNEPFNPEDDTGPTSDANLDPKCRSHHRLKGMRGWVSSSTTTAPSCGSCRAVTRTSSSRRR